MIYVKNMKQKNLTVGNIQDATIVLQIGDKNARYASNNDVILFFYIKKYKFLNITKLSYFFKNFISFKFQPKIFHV